MGATWKKVGISRGRAKNLTGKTESIWVDGYLVLSKQSVGNRTHSETCSRLIKIQWSVGICWELVLGYLQIPTSEDAQVSDKMV